MKETLFTSLILLVSLSGFTQEMDTLGIDDYRGGTSTLYTSPNGGYAFGNNGYGDLVKAQEFTIESGTTLHKVLLIFGEVIFESGDLNSSINVNIYNNYGPGIEVGYGVLHDSIAPDSILASVNIPVSQLLDDGSFTIADFTSQNVLVPANFSVGIDVGQLAAGDTVGLNSTTDGDANGINEAWELTSDSVWFQVAELAYSWNLDVQLAMFPIIDALEPASVYDQEIPVSFYPNPCTDFLNLKFEKGGQYQIELRDATGRIVRSTTLSTNDVRTTIDISGLVPGLYVLKATDGNLQSSYTLIKQ